MKITFLGATEVVTGSKTLVENKNDRILVDCGLFQGDRELRKRNWEPFPIDPRTIHAMVLTHAHIDHTGYIPVLVKNGFKGPIYCSKATVALCEIMLIDSAKLQEEDAKKINERRGKEVVSPLYTVDDAQRALRYFKTVAYDTPFTIGSSLTIKLVNSGHILGAAFIIVTDDAQTTLTFSGDLGRPDQLIMKAPPYIQHTDFLLLESTYGNRLHQEGDPMKMLGNIINATVKKGGVVIIPAFAVGRTQALLYCLYMLMEKKIIPTIPVFLDSPMGISVTNLFCEFSNEHKLSPTMCTNVFDRVIYTHTVKESKKIDQLKEPAIIIAGSGMADGGRVADHFKKFISNAKNSVIFVGFQAKGTEGRALIEGAKEIDIHGERYPVRATIQKINSLSAHSDYEEILEWLSHFEKSPKKTFLNHGEADAAKALKKKIEDRFGWEVIIPNYLESFELD